MAVAAADLDGDRDLDLVALLAGAADVDEKVLAALVWLEQTRRACSCGIQSRWALRGTPRGMSATSTATARPISWSEIVIAGSRSRRGWTSG